MADNDREEDRYSPVNVELKNQGLAALWAWLWPGAGHIYQGRYAKGAIFMICILVTYFWGLAMGRGQVVYASFKKPDIRYPFICQVGVGLPALPALVQSYRINNGKDPLWGKEIMTPPGRPGQPYLEQEYDIAAQRHLELGFYFELGTLYTMVAGLLNILAIYDAHSGPVFTAPGKAGNKRVTDNPEDEAESDS